MINSFGSNKEVLANKYIQTARSVIYRPKIKKTIKVYIFLIWFFSFIQRSICRGRWFRNL